jgi:anti-anti-sigma regulatory factor
MISRQSDEQLELSTPVIHLWDSIRALPLIGTLDSARASGTAGRYRENLDEGQA